MADFTFSVDTRQLDKALQDVAASMEEFPAGSQNPLKAWRLEYGIRTTNSPRRPTVGSPGSFRGNPWPALEPQYTRKTDGVTVPVYGGVSRAVMGDRVNLGVVTRASGRPRRAADLTRSQKRAGFGVVKEGQVFSQATVLGKLRQDGTRYAASDLQLYKDSPGSLLGDWANSDPILSNNGKTITVVTSVKYAEKVHEKRPFAYGGDIDREETASMMENIIRYLKERLPSGGN